MKHAGQIPTESTITLPTSVLLWTVLGVAAIFATVWVMVSRLGGWATDVQTAGAVGGAIVGGVGALGVLAMGPWKPRPISGWMTMWLLSTVIRLFITPAATFLLYFAASPNASALTLSVALAYLAVLAAETAVLARHVSQVVYPPLADRGAAAGSQAHSDS